MKKIKVKLRPDILEYLGGCGYEAEPEGDAYSKSNDVRFVMDMNRDDVFEVIVRGRYYCCEETSYLYKEDWLIFEEEQQPDDKPKSGIYTFEDLEKALEVVETSKDLELQYQAEISKLKEENEKLEEAIEFLQAIIKHLIKEK